MARWDITEYSIMKKISLLLTAILFTAAFSSCSLFGDKDGEYSPKEQISRKYYDDGEGKTLSQVWNWNDKQLQSIDHYSYSGSISWTEDFSYNKKGQIERVDDYANRESTEYTYDGKKLSKATYYYKGSIEYELTFMYDGNKISRIEYMELGKGRNNRMFKEGFSPLNLLLPEKSLEKLHTILNRATDSREYVTVELTWEKDNVSKIEVFEGGFRATYSFKFDDKLNPYTGFFSLYPEESIIEDLSLNKNNPTQLTYTESEDGDTYSETVRYSYTYDGKFPTVQRMTFTESYEDWSTGEIITETWTVSIFYEYK